jgi:hypothetical protein
VLGAYGCYLFGARERKDEIVGTIAEPRTQKEAHLLRYLYHCTTISKQPGGCFWGELLRTPLRRSSQNYPSARLGV